jgi:hypothetical protein
MEAEVDDTHTLNSAFKGFSDALRSSPCGVGADQRRIKSAHLGMLLHQYQGLTGQRDYSTLSVLGFVESQCAALQVYIRPAQREQFPPLGPVASPRTTMV